MRAAWENKYSVWPGIQSNSSVRLSFLRLLLFLSYSAKKFVTHPRSDTP